MQTQFYHNSLSIIDTHTYEHELLIKYIVNSISVIAMTTFHLNSILMYIDSHCQSIAIYLQKDKMRL